MASIPGTEGVRYAFIVRWIDPMTQIHWKYQFFYHTADKSIELFDIKNQRVFLRRIAYPSIDVEHLFLGGTVLVYTRTLVLEEFGDEFTRKRLGSQVQSTFALIKPDAYHHIGKIIDAVYKNGLIIKQLKMCRLTQEEAGRFYIAHRKKDFYAELTALMASGPCVAMELVAIDAVQRWRVLIGPTNTEVAKLKAPSSLRALFGTDSTRNAVHGADSCAAAQQEIKYFFRDPKFGFSARLQNCSLCIIKPHAVHDGVSGVVIDAILKKFNISAMEMLILTRQQCSVLYEVYEGVLPDFEAMTHELAYGPCIALEISDKVDPSVCPVESFREFCGPIDAQLAQALRPNTLRAHFGKNKVTNGVHATDLPEDGVSECKFIFNRQYVGIR